MEAVVNIHVVTSCLDKLIGSPGLRALCATYVLSGNPVCHAGGDYRAGNGSLWEEHGVDRGGSRLQPAASGLKINN